MFYIFGAKVVVRCTNWLGVCNPTTSLRACDVTMLSALKKIQRDSTKAHPPQGTRGSATLASRTNVIYCTFKKSAACPRHGKDSRQISQSASSSLISTSINKHCKGRGSLCGRQKLPQILCLMDSLYTPMILMSLFSFAHFHAFHYLSSQFSIVQDITPLQ